MSDEVERTDAPDESEPTITVREHDRKVRELSDRWKDKAREVIGAEFADQLTELDTLRGTHRQALAEIDDVTRERDQLRRSFEALQTEHVRVVEANRLAEARDAIVTALRQKNLLAFGGAVLDLPFDDIDQIYNAIDALAEARDEEVDREMARRLDTGAKRPARTAKPNGQPTVQGLESIYTESDR